MDWKQLAEGNVGKRMAAFAWAVWLITEKAPDDQGRIIIAILAVAYIVCQTVSDYLERKVKEK